MTSSQAATGGTFQVLTSRGPAAIAVVCLRGGLAHTFLPTHVRAPRRGESKTWPDGAVFRAALLDEDGAAIDDILVSVHAIEPAVDVRLHLHGSPWLVAKCAELLRNSGLIEDREHASGLWRSDSLIESEAHALLPEMLTLRGVEWLVRQPELLAKTLREIADAADVESAKQVCRDIIARREIVERFRRPFRIAIIGPPNAGKSTLANAFADRQVSVVSPQPGTTRDWVESFGEIAGFPVAWFDTAGLRETDCELEAEGVRRSLKLAEAADATVLVLDATAAEAWADVIDGLGKPPACVAINKVDLARQGADLLKPLPEDYREQAVRISAGTSEGLEALEARLAEIVGFDDSVLSRPSAYTDRQVDHLTAALSLNRDGFSQTLREIATSKR